MRLGDVKNIWKPLRILRKPSWMSGVDSIFRGGSSFAFVKKAVTSYLVEREDSDARLAAAVHEWYARMAKAEVGSWNRLERSFESR